MQLAISSCFRCFSLWSAACNKELSMDYLESLIQKYEALFSMDARSMDPQALADQQKRLEALGRKISQLKREPAGQE